MNRAELIRAVAEKAKFTASDAELAIDAVISCVTEELKTGESVRLLGLGTFSVADRPARSGRNPLTGEALVLPAGKVPSFKYSKTLKDAVNA